MEPEREGEDIRGESCSVSQGEIAFLEHVCSWGGSSRHLSSVCSSEKTNW